LFDRPPRSADVEIWPRLFTDEIGRPPQIRHQTFGWDSPDGDFGEAEAFVAKGFRLMHSSVLTASEVAPPPHEVAELIVRTLESDDDWVQATENQIRCREEEHDEGGYRIFKEAAMRRYRSMAQAGLGAWFGGFLGEILVADLGIYHDKRLGRFQSVETHPGHRRRGLAGTLVHQAARHALGEMGINTLVLVADADSQAERIYRSVGFLPAERQVGLERW
jgi:GNAT superfamily N-acetyltransferase